MDKMASGKLDAFICLDGRTAYAALAALAFRLPSAPVALLHESGTFVRFTQAGAYLFA
jgi:hypothetical protein